MELTKTCEGVFIEQSYFLYRKESQPFSYSSVDYISETKKGIKECKIVPGYFAPWFTFTSRAIINLMIDSELKLRCQNQICISLLNPELDKAPF